MKNHLLVLACTALLSACGGGGTTDSLAGADPIDRYVGTWTKKCDTWSAADISDMNGNGVSVIEVLKFEKASATKANYTYTIKVFAHSDTTCSNQPIATLIKTGLNNNSTATAGATMTTGFGTNELTYLGTQKLRIETVDKLQISEAKLTNIVGNVTVGGAIVNSGSPIFQQYNIETLSKFKSDTQILLNSIDNGVIPDEMKDDEYMVLTKQ
jgi:hypothetical protein